MELILSGLLENYDLSAISIKRVGAEGRTAHYKGLFRQSSDAGAQKNI